MHRITASLLGLLVLGTSLFASVAKAQEPVNHQKLEETMGWMVGAWEDGRGQRSFKWGLKGQVITWAEVDPEMATATFYWDPSDKKVKAVGFGAAGWNISAVVEQATGKQIKASILNVTPSGNKLTGTLTYTLTEPGKMLVEMKIKPSQEHDEVLPDQTWNLTKVEPAR